jgi:hypothetical protein
MGDDCTKCNIYHEAEGRKIISFHYERQFGATHGIYETLPNKYRSK